MKKAILVLCAAVMCGCSKPDIVIGLAGSFSGTDSSLAVEGRNAALLWMLEINSSGGIDGRHVRIETYNTENASSTMIKSVEDLADAGAIAIVGYFRSSSVETVIPRAQELGMAVISPTATSESLSGRDDVFFRTIMSSKNDPSAISHLMRDRGSKGFIAIIDKTNLSYAETYMSYLRNRENAVAEFLFDPLTHSRLFMDGGFGSADSCMIIASAVNTAHIAQDLRHSGFEGTFYASGWAASDDLVIHGGSAVEGMLFVHQIDDSIGPDTPKGLSDFYSLYKTTYSASPPFAAIETRDALCFVTAVIRAGGTTRQSFLEKARTISEFGCISGTITMDEYGDATRALYVKTIRDGKIIVVERFPVER